MPRWISASSGTAAKPADVSGTSDQMRDLAAYPLATGLTITTQTAGGNLGTAVSTVTGTVLTPLWTASTYYPAGSTVLDPTNTQWSLSTLVRTTAGTSGTTYDATEQGKWTTRTGGGPTGYPVRYNAARLRSSEGNGVPMFIPRDRHKTDNSENNQYALRPQQWSIDFDWYTVAGALEVPVFGQCQVRFIVDGKYVSAAPTIPIPATPNTAEFNWRHIKLSGATAGLHRVRVEFGGIQPQMAGVKIATADRLFPPSIPPTKSLVLFGDSIAEGAAAVDSTSAPLTADVRGYGFQLGKLLGISNYYSLAVSASGYTLPATQAFAAGIQDIAALAPDYVLVASTGNDQNNLATLPTAIADFCTQLKAALVNLPNTKVVISGVPIYGSAPSVAETINPIIKTAVEAAGLTYLDTTSWSYNMPAGLISNDTLHPTVTGAEYVARRYAAALSPIWNIPL